jgi:hypothetical protein
MAVGRRGGSGREGIEPGPVRTAPVRCGTTPLAHSPWAVSGETRADDLCQSCLIGKIEKAERWPSQNVVERRWRWRMTKLA